MSNELDWLDSSSDEDIARDSRVQREKLWAEGFRDGEEHNYAANNQDCEPGISVSFKYVTFLHAGVDSGKEETIQLGFNIGFAEGSEAGAAWGEARGAAALLKALQGRLREERLKVRCAAREPYFCCLLAQPRSPPGALGQPPPPLCQCRAGCLSRDLVKRPGRGHGAGASHG